jgi:hypothetical protein
LPEDDLALAQALADIATISSERAIHRRDVLTEQLQTALNSRVIIEQAKGVLARYGGLSMDHAFAMLRGYVRANNLRLAQVARLIAERELDPTVITSYAIQAHSNAASSPPIGRGGSAVPCSSGRVRVGGI